MVGDEVVVDEEEVAPRLGPDLGHDLVDGADVVTVVEVGADGAVLAAEAAASAELQQRHRQVALALVDVAPGLRARLRCADGRVVAGSQSALVSVRDHLRPARLGVAGEDGVGVLGDLVGQGRGVDAAHDHGHMPSRGTRRRSRRRGGP